MRARGNCVTSGVVCALIALGASAGNAVAQEVMRAASIPQEINLQGATPREQALVRNQIQIMSPEVLPLRIIFVPH